MCSLRPEAVAGPRWFTIAKAADLTGSASLCLRIRPSYCTLITAMAERGGIKGSRGSEEKNIGGGGEERKKERGRNDRTITVEGDHHHIRVFHEKATSGA